MKLMRTRLGALVLSLTVLICSTACQEPVAVPLGKEAVVEGTTFKVTGYDIRYIELAVGDKFYEYSRPVMTIQLEIKNTGESPLSYNPTHNTPQMSEKTTPLLYNDPGGETKLPPKNKAGVINGVNLTKGKLEGQITENTQIAPGKSVRDTFLFEVPEGQAQKMIFSIPPSMHRGDLPVLVRLDYKAQKAKGKKNNGLGETVAFKGVSFTANKAELAYIKTNDTAQGEGFSSTPLLKIAYTVKNGSEEEITYEPNHLASGAAPAAAVYHDGKPLKRIQFAPSTKAVGQITGKKKLAAGEEAEDFVLFEKPEEGALTLEYPSVLFERQGVARYTFEVDTTVPPKPKELTKKKPAEEKKEDEK